MKTIDGKKVLCVWDDPEWNPKNLIKGVVCGENDYFDKNSEPTRVTHYGNNEVGLIF